MSIKSNNLNRINKSSHPCSLSAGIHKIVKKKTINIL